MSWLIKNNKKAKSPSPTLIQPTHPQRSLLSTFLGKNHISDKNNQIFRNNITKNQIRSQSPTQFNKFSQLIRREKQKKQRAKSRKNIIFTENNCFSRAVAEYRQQQKLQNTLKLKRPAVIEQAQLEESIESGMPLKVLNNYEQSVGEISVNGLKQQQRIDKQLLGKRQVANKDCFTMNQANRNSSSQLVSGCRDFRDGCGYSKQNRSVSKQQGLKRIQNSRRYIESGTLGEYGGGDEMNSVQTLKKVESCQNHPEVKVQQKLLEENSDDKRECVVRNNYNGLMVERVEYQTITTLIENKVLSYQMPYINQTKMDSLTQVITYIQY